MRLIDLYEKHKPAGDALRVFSETGWLSVEVGLPDPEERVLCCSRTKKGQLNILIGYHDGDRWCCGMNSNVIAWQPLPELPDL